MTTITLPAPWWSSRWRPSRCKNQERKLMTIKTGTPKYKGYRAFCEGKPLNSNPYYITLLLSGMTNSIEWQEWNDGWHQASNENMFGIDIIKQVRSNYNE